MSGRGYAGLLPAWIVFLVATLVGGFLAGALAGGMVGFVMGMAGADMAAIQRASGIAGFLAGLPVSFFAFAWSVRRFVLGHATAATSSIAAPPPVA